VSLSAGKIRIHYRAVHEDNPWRRADTHGSLESAITGLNGANALLLKTPRMAGRWTRWGRPLCVFVWEDGEAGGYVVRVDPNDATKVRAVRVPDGIIQHHEAEGSCSEAELNRIFITYADPR